MRILIYIPVLRTQEDRKALAEALRRRALNSLGVQESQPSVPNSRQIWDLIREAVEKMNLPYPQVRLYQDQLPHNDRALQMVMDLARAGSPNHQLLHFLVRKGATVVGTESPDLLLEDYQLVRQTLDALRLGETEEVPARLQVWSSALLERRDRYIAQRIASTLRHEETGLLFLDMLHSADKYLSRDIRVLYPFLRPASKG